jgi:hypothetical protein
MTPNTTADMNVPAKANVKIGPMFRKKLVYGMLVVCSKFRPAQLT